MVRPDEDVRREAAGVLYLLHQIGSVFAHAELFGRDHALRRRRRPTPRSRRPLERRVAVDTRRFADHVRRDVTVVVLGGGVQYPFKLGACVRHQGGRLAADFGVDRHLLGDDVARGAALDPADVHSCRAVAVAGLFRTRSGSRPRRPAWRSPPRSAPSPRVHSRPRTWPSGVPSPAGSPHRRRSHPSGDLSRREARTGNRRRRGDRSRPSPCRRRRSPLPAGRTP